MPSMTFRALILAGCATAVIGLSACGKDAGETVEEVGGAALVELTGGSPIAKPFRLQGADPADLDRFNALLESSAERPFQVGAASFDENIGAIVLSDVSNTEEGRVLTIARAELYGVNFDYLEAARAGAVPAGEHSLFRKVRLFDITLSGYEEMDFNGTLTLEALELDRLDLDRAGPVDDVIAGGFDLGGLYLVNAGFDGDGAEGVSFTGKLADLRLDGIARGKIGPVALAGVEYTVKQDVEAMKASLAESGEGMPFAALADGPLRNFFFPAQQTTLIPSLQWDGADLSGLFDYLEQGETPPLEATGLISVGRAEATDMQTLVNGKRASFTEYSVLEPVEFEWLVPTKIRATSRGMLTDMTAYVPADEPELLAIVKDHGLDKLSSEGSLSWAYDAGEGAADLTYDITMQDFGDVDMNFGLSGAPLPQLYQAVTTENPMMLMGMAVDGLSIRIRDREMVDTAVEIAALQTGQDAGELRDSLPAMLELGSAQAAAVIPEINDYVAALSAFVSDGGTLEIAMTPDEPVPLMTLMLLSQTSPQMIPSTLALRVTHDE